MAELSWTSAFNYVATDIRRRSTKVLSATAITTLTALSFLPQAKADYPNLNTSNPNYDGFIAEPVDETTDDGEKVAADIVNINTQSLNYPVWVNRATQIRLSGNHDYCVGNLSVALAGVGAAYQADSNGATTLLTLIPTASNLIGPAAREIWVLYNLCPIAGILSMFLALGGSIVPTEVNEYEHIDSFSYSGLVGTHADERIQNPDEISASKGKSRAEVFADEVAKRASKDIGATKSYLVLVCLGLQFFCLGLILFACWFLESGSIVVWLCQVNWWMYLWYIITAFSAVLDNLAGVPFTKYWVVRCSKAPRVNISDDAPWVYDPAERPKATEPRPGIIPRASSNLPAGARSPDLNSIRSGPMTPGILSPSFDPALTGDERYFTEHEHQPKATPIMDSFRHGFNTTSRIQIDPTYSCHDEPFYVIISIKGVEAYHAGLRIISKIVSVLAYAIATALFASSTLQTIIVAVITAILILSAGIFARVTSMWMTAALMKNKPVIHRMVRNPYEAEQYLGAMLRKDHILFEVMGHAVLNGRCIKRFRNHMRWSKVVGVLARPFNLATIGVPFPEEKPVANGTRTNTQKPMS